MVLYYATNRLKIGSASGKQQIVGSSRVTGKPAIIHNAKPSGETGLDSLRNQALSQLCAFSSPISSTVGTFQCAAAALER